MFARGVRPGQVGSPPTRSRPSSLSSLWPRPRLRSLGCSSTCLLSAFWAAAKEGKSRVFGSPFPLQTRLTPWPAQKNQWGRCPVSPGESSCHVPGWRPAEPRVRLEEGPHGAQLGGGGVGGGDGGRGGGGSWGGDGGGERQHRASRQPGHGLWKDPSFSRKVYSFSLHILGAQRRKLQTFMADLCPSWCKARLHCSGQQLRLSLPLMDRSPVTAPRGGQAQKWAQEGDLC